MNRHGVSCELERLNSAAINASMIDGATKGAQLRLRSHMLHASAEPSQAGGRSIALVGLLAGVAVGWGLLRGGPPELRPLGGAGGGRGGDQALQRLNAERCRSTALPCHLHTHTNTRTGSRMHDQNKTCEDTKT